MKTSRFSHFHSLFKMKLHFFSLLNFFFFFLLLFLLFIVLFKSLYSCRCFCCSYSFIICRSCVCVFVCVNIFFLSCLWEIIKCISFIGFKLFLHYTPAQLTNHTNSIASRSYFCFHRNHISYVHIKILLTIIHKVSILSATSCPQVVVVTIYLFISLLLLFFCAHFDEVS